MKEQMPQSKTGTFRACLQLPLHLEAPAALCKMLPELLKLFKAQQQSSRLARVPVGIPAPCVFPWPGACCLSPERCWDRFPAPLALAREAAEGRPNVSQGGSAPPAKCASALWRIHCCAVALGFGNPSAAGLVLWLVWS